MGCFILAATMESHLNTLGLDKLQRNDNMFQRLQQTISDCLVEFDLGHFDVPRQIPAQMYHGHDALETLIFVPFIAFDAQLILSGRQWSNIPCDIVAPSDRLHPMHTAGIHPHQIAWSLNETIDGYVGFVQIVQHRPPRTMQVIDIVLLAQRLYATPIRIRHSEPLTITRTNIDVDGTEVIVLLVTGCSRAGHLHVQLNRVHAENDVANVRQHIAGRHNACE